LKSSTEIAVVPGYSCLVYVVYLLLNAKKTLCVRSAGKVTVYFSDDSLENIYKIVLYWGILPGNGSIQSSVAVFIVWINNRAT